MTYKNRLIQPGLAELHLRDRGRLLVLTGARQTGKSTLVRRAFPDYPVVDLDAPMERAVYEKLGPADWIHRYPRAIIDEAQKLPGIFETIKACYDRSPDVRYLLLGSSQILLMSQVRETLAGRVALRELFPLTLPELTAPPGTSPRQSVLMHVLTAPRPAEAAADLLPPDRFLGDASAASRNAWQSYLRFGGMPRLYTEDWTDPDRAEWLADYQQTYLQRDLIDLARLDRLEPFVRAQHAAALRTAQVINFSELARLSGVSPPTAQQFMRYLEISYQVALLPAWFRNLEKRLVRRPKLHFVDPGVRRAILNRRGAPDGAEHESAIVSEVVKQCRTLRLQVELFHLRTQDGREVDLLIERDDGFIAIECKQSSHVVPGDARHVHHLDSLLDKPLLLGLVVSDDQATGMLGDAGAAPVWNVAAPALLGPAG